MSLAQQQKLSLLPPAGLETLGHMAEFYSINQSDDLEAVAGAIQTTIRRVSPVISDLSNILSENDNPEALDGMIALAVLGQRVIKDQQQLTEIVKTMADGGYQPQGHTSSQKLSGTFKGQDIGDAEAEVTTRIDPNVLDITPLLTANRNLAQRLIDSGATFGEAHAEQTERIFDSLNRIHMQAVNLRGEITPGLAAQLNDVTTQIEKLRDQESALSSSETYKPMMAA